MYYNVRVLTMCFNCSLKFRKAESFCEFLEPIQNIKELVCIFRNLLDDYQRIEKTSLSLIKGGRFGTGPIIPFGTRIVKWLTHR